MKRIFRRSLAISAFLLLSVVFWLHTTEERNMEGAIRSFTFYVLKHEYHDAFGCMSKQYRKDNSLAGFMASSWCNASNVIYTTSVANGHMQKIYIRSFAPITTRASAIITTATFKFPLCFEDGFTAVRMKLVKEGEDWKVDGVADTIMR